MKLFISPLKIILTFLISSLVAAFLLFGLFYKSFLTWPWDIIPYCVIAIWLALSIIYLILSLKANYYVLEDKYVCVHRFKKEMYYYFKDVVYIDEIYSKKHKTIRFVTNRGDIRYLTFDKENKLYPIFLKKCKNILNYDELMIKYPNLKGIKKY